MTETYWQLDQLPDGRVGDLTDQEQAVVLGTMAIWLQMERLDLCRQMRKVVKSRQLLSNADRPAGKASG